MEKYVDRHQAGKILAKHLKEFEKKSNVIVLALPRGGVPVAYEVAQSLSVPLEAFIVRKLGVPGQEELAMGAIASGDTVIFNNDILEALEVDPLIVEKVIQSEKKELARREVAYRDHRVFPDLLGKTVIIVDDGIATGATMKAAVKAVRLKNPAKVIIAVPVAALSTCQEMGNLADQIVCPLQPSYFGAVGAWYENFSQTTDEEVSVLLKG